MFSVVINALLINDIYLLYSLEYYIRSYYNANNITIINNKRNLYPIQNPSLYYDTICVNLCVKTTVQFFDYHPGAENEIGIWVSTVP